MVDLTITASAAKTAIEAVDALTGDVVGTSDTQTLTNKTITAPVLGGTITGTYTIGGTPTFPAAVAQLTATQTLTNKTIDVDNNTVSNIEVDNLKTSAKTGSDTKVVTGTEGTSGNLVQWNADGDAVDSSIAAANVVVDSDITNMVESDTSADGVTGSDAITNIVSCTQAEYDAGTPDSATVYLITD